MPDIIPAGTYAILENPGTEYRRIRAEERREIRRKLRGKVKRLKRGPKPGPPPTMEERRRRAEHSRQLVELKHGVQHSLYLLIPKETMCRVQAFVDSGRYASKRKFILQAIENELDRQGEWVEAGRITKTEDSRNDADYSDRL